MAAREVDRSRRTMNARVPPASKGRGVGTALASR